MKWTLIATMVLLLCACNDSKQDIGQFVYVDCFNTIHIDRQCASKLADNPKSKEERIANMHGVTFIDTCKLTPYGNQYMKYDFCPRCIDDGTFRHLSAIMEQNEKQAQQAAF